MARFQPVFGEMAVSMVRAGGEGGFLEEALTAWPSSPKRRTI